MLARDKELDTLCEKVFEEKILGNLSEDQFLKLSQKYEDEQFELKAQIKHMKKVVAEEKSHELNADGFLQIMRKYSNIEELTTEILHEFIDKIIVHHKEKVFGKTIQRVEIYYKMIGQVQIPKFSRSQKCGYKKYWGYIKKSRLLVNQSTLQKENHKNIPCLLWYSTLVLVAGLEPARYRYRGILSPLCLPIPPHQHI